MKNKRHGMGEYSEADGSVYRGEYVLGVRHGQGCFVSGPGKDGTTCSYEGRWREDMYDGDGTYVYEDGTSYVGKWAHNMKHRHGRQTFPDGSVYEGGFLRDKFQGQGRLVYAAGGVYEGAWVEGRMQGHGVFTAVEGEVYDGDWEGDQKHGVGRCVYQSGAVYEGEWQHDMRHGDGYYVGNDGTSYKVRDQHVTRQGCVVRTHHIHPYVLHTSYYILYNTWNRSVASKRGEENEEMRSQVYVLFVVYTSLVHDLIEIMLVVITNVVHACAGAIHQGSEAWLWYV